MVYRHNERYLGHTSLAEVLKPEGKVIKSRARGVAESILGGKTELRGQKQAYSTQSFDCLACRHLTKR